MSLLGLGGSTLFGVDWRPVDIFTPICGHHRLDLVFKEETKQED